MAEPAAHIPRSIPEHAILTLLNSIGVPKPVRVEKTQTTAAYHAIYRVVLSQKFKGFHELILRIAGPHLPHIKTENEAAVLRWVKENTSIPVPTVLHYDSRTENALRNEYILLSREPGSVLADMYYLLDDAQLTALIDQLIDYLLELHAVEWDTIGGLQIESGKVVPGPVLEETFWQQPDIQKYWPGESVQSLNISGPFPSYVDYITGQFEKYIYAIEQHDLLESMRDLIPLLHQFLNKLDDDRKNLNNIKIRLSHKDLHLGNILYSAELGKITSILDWEFAGTVPFTRWDPVRAFLWNGREDSAEKTERKRLLDIFVERCRARGVSLVEDAKYTSVRQEKMQTAANYLRAIVEVCPRGQQQEVVPQWRKSLLECMAVFGVRKA